MALSLKDINSNGIKKERLDKAITKNRACSLNDNKYAGIEISPHCEIERPLGSAMPWSEIGHIDKSGYTSKFVDRDEQDLHKSSLDKDYQVDNAETFFENRSNHVSKDYQHGGVALWCEVLNVI